jgi:acyl dehydratase
VFFEDIELGTTIRVGSYRVERDDIVAFARRWDPLDIHTDESTGVTASGSHLMAIRTLLLHQLPTREAVIVGAGWGNVRFHVPVHSGDELWLEATWLTKRRSASKRDRGIVNASMKLVNQSGVVVVSHEDTIFMRLRNPD